MEHPPEKQINHKVQPVIDGTFIAGCKNVICTVEPLFSHLHYLTTAWLELRIWLELP